MSNREDNTAFENVTRFGRFAYYYIFALMICLFIALILPQNAAGNILAIILLVLSPLFAAIPLGGRVEKAKCPKPDEREIWKRALRLAMVPTIIVLTIWALITAFITWFTYKFYSQSDDPFAIFRDIHETWGFGGIVAAIAICLLIFALYTCFNAALIRLGLWLGMMKRKR